MNFNKGFTLLEVIVSLFILAIILTSSFELLNSAIHSEKYIRDKTLANWLAQNYAIEQQIKATWPQLGVHTSSINMGMSQWKVHSYTTSTKDKQFRKTKISIFRNIDNDEPISQLHFYSAKDIRW